MLNPKAYGGRVDQPMESYVEFDQSGYHWTLKPEFSSIIRDEIIPLVLSGKDFPGLRVIKRKLTRDSLIISLDDSSPEIFAKIHKYDKRKERIKTLVRASRARAEWTRGESMLRSGLPVAESLGMGERRSGLLVTGCVLFQRALPHCLRLGDYLSQIRSGERKQSAGRREGDRRSDAAPSRVALLESLGRLIGQMHSAGFWHPDLHTGNVLVDQDTSPPKIWLVDLHAAGQSSHITRRRKMADLAKMIVSLAGYYEESELCGLLAGYEPESAEREREEKLSDLLAAAESLRKRRLKSRSKRCLKTSGKFVVERVGNKKLYRSRDYDVDDILGAVSRHKEVSGSKGPELVKGTSKSVLTSFALSSEDGNTIYVKEFANRGMIKILETVFYVHRGRRAWKAGHRLRLLRIPTAQLIALVEENRFGLLHSSYLLMKEIPDAVRLNVFLLRRFFRASGRLTREEILEKRDLIRAGAVALREFHRKNVYHKDLSTKNLLVSVDGQDDIHFFCVDLDSIQFPPKIFLRRRIKNMAQLNGLPSCITTTDRIRFYKQYFGLQRLTSKHKLFIYLIRWSSRSRMEHARRMDARIKRNLPLEEKTYEDFTSV